MLVSDRLLVALGEFLNDDLALGLVPRLRDWSGTKGAQTLILDAEEPEEHEGLDGVYELEGEVCLRFRNRDFTETEQRDDLAAVNDALRARAIDWINDVTNARGLDGDGLKVFDFRTDDGAWEQEDKWLNGKIRFSAVIVGQDPV